MQKITPFLWYDGKAEEAANFYISIFKKGKILEIMRCAEAGPGPRGSVLTVMFEIHGQQFIALNGGPHYKFTPAFSLFVDCETQAEVDELWEKLSEGGEKVQCGWLTDKYGVSWQIVPNGFLKLINDPDPVKSTRAMQAMMKMVKLDLGELKRAAEGK